MTILAEHRLLAVPDRRVIELYDADAYVGTSAVLDQLDEHVVAGDGYHLYIGSLQSGVGVEVTIRVHSAPPATWPPADGSTELTLECTTGSLIVGEFTAGVAGEVELPAPASTGSAPPGRDVSQQPTRPPPSACAPSRNSGAEQPHDRHWTPSQAPKRTASTCGTSTNPKTTTRNDRSLSKTGEAGAPRAGLTAAHRDGEARSARQ